MKVKQVVFCHLFYVISRLHRILAYAMIKLPSAILIIALFSGKSIIILKTLLEVTMKKTLFFAVLLCLVMLMTISSFSATLRGDANNDGKISIEDICICLRMFINNEASSKMDINCDGTLNLLDILYLLKISVGEKDMIVFSPIDIDGLVAKFDASKLSLNDGDKVTKWENTAFSDKFDAIYIHF